jgi:hypothetical protein
MTYNGFNPKNSNAIDCATDDKILKWILELVCKSMDGIKMAQDKSLAETCERFNKRQGIS